MVIGIDASRAFVAERTGTEEYSLQVISHMLSLPTASKHTFVLFTRANAIIPAEIPRLNVIIKELKYRYLWTQVGLAAATWQNKLDVLWVPAHTLPVLRKPDLKTVVTIHGLEYKWLPEYRNLLQRWYLPLSTYYAAKNATALISVSQNTKNDLLKEVQIDHNSIKVILEGVNKPANQLIDESIKKKILEKYGLTAGKYILFVGTIQPRKNLPALISAFTHFTRNNPGYKLCISGSKGFGSQEVFQAVTREGVEELVVFTGRISEETKQILLSQANVYVQPSITEGFGLPMLEAMQNAIPVICSDGGAMPEVVDGAAVVVKLGKDFSLRLAESLEQVSANVKLRQKLIAVGKKRVSELKWEKCANETLSVLTNL